MNLKELEYERCQIFKKGRGGFFAKTLNSWDTIYLFQLLLHVEFKKYSK